MIRRRRPSRRDWPAPCRVYGSIEVVWTRDADRRMRAYTKAARLPRGEVSALRRSAEGTALRRAGQGSLGFNLDRVRVTLADVTAATAGIVRQGAASDAAA